MMDVKYWNGGDWITLPQGTPTPAEPTATKDELGRLYYQFTTLNMGHGRQILENYRTQAAIIGRNQRQVKEYYGQHGNLRGLNIGGLDTQAINTLETILQRPLHDLYFAMVK